MYLTIIFLAWINNLALSQNLYYANNGIQTHLLSKRIVGGQEATEGDGRWLVVIKKEGTFKCTGSLIDSFWVLTAAHCVDDKSAFVAELGVYDRSKYEPNAIQSIKVSRIILHPNFNSSSLYHDIALLKLDKPAVLNNRVVIIPIVDFTSFPLGVEAWLTGWGATYRSGSSQTLKRNVSVPILSDSQCCSQHIMKGYVIQSLTQLCAGKVGSQRGGCSFDDGASLVYIKNSKPYLAGILSFGFSCGDGDVYTRVAAFQNWMSQNEVNWKKWLQISLST